jgi:phospholipid N-methyltransferase
MSRPTQVASVIPSSPTLIRRVMSKFDLSQPRVIAEFGPGEGCFSRALARRLCDGSRLLLLELDPHLSRHLAHQFRDDPRVEVAHADAAHISGVLADRGLSYCDYVLSGIPFGFLDPHKKRELLQKTFQALVPAPHAAFIVYQVTAELRRHTAAFPRSEAEYCVANIPPLHLIKFYRTAPGQEISPRRPAVEPLSSKNGGLVGTN